MAYPFIIQGNNIVVVIDSKSHTISKTHITYQKVVDAIKAGDWDTVKEVIDPKQVVLNYGAGNVTIQDGVLFWKGEPTHSYLSTKIIEMLQEGLPIDPLVNFMHNLMSNPSARAVRELYGFLEKGGMPITPDGYFLAYKKIRANWTDVHSGKMDNSIGKVVEMERNAVDDNKDQTCSTGLHFCSRSYLDHFGGERIVILKINPRDVVSIPSDYNDAKGRACRYEVIGELEGETKTAPEKAFTAAVQSNGFGVNEKTATVNPQAVWPFAKAAAAPVVSTGPKVGKSEYTRGYTDGFNGFHLASADIDYGNGFAAGRTDKRNGMPMKYRYASATPAAPKVAQDYDKNGRPLSMTKDAIRKRKARAAKAAAALAQPVYRNTGWPAPKGS